MPPQETPPQPSGDMVPQPELQPVEPKPKRSRKILLAIACIVVVAILGVVGWLVFKPDSSKPKPSISQSNQYIVTKPDYGNIKVGSYRYVNACLALPFTDQQNNFAGIAQAANFAAIYAENSLPAQEIDTNITKSVSSMCTREFGSDTPYAGTTMTFFVYQYTSPTKAEAAFNRQKSAANTAPLSGAANTVYNTSSNTSYTLSGNMVLSFSALFGSGMSANRFQQDIAKALPGVLVKAKDQNTPQYFNTDSDFGQKIGEATYFEPCKLFTDADFKAITGVPNDPTNVKYEYRYSSLVDFYSDTSSGEANNRCTRLNYPGKGPGEGIRVQIDYFKSASEAAASIQQDAADFRSLGDTIQQVPGVGEHAFYREADDGGLTYLYVQKGPYMLELNINIGAQNTRSVDNYKKAAITLLPKLQ